jgi:hypothetical protein
MLMYVKFAQCVLIFKDYVIPDREQASRTQWYRSYSRNELLTSHIPKHWLGVDFKDLNVPYKMSPTTDR